MEAVRLTEKSGSICQSKVSCSCRL